MRVSSEPKHKVPLRHKVPSSPAAVPQWLAPPDDAEDDHARRGARVDRLSAERDDLPYRVELWDAGKLSVEQTLAVTANASIGYAAYYAATREHPERYITLRHKNRIVTRWNGPEH